MFTFGSAHYFGSGAATGQRFSGLARTTTGRGYWLVTRASTLVRFGDAT